MTRWLQRSTRKPKSETYELRIAGEVVPYTVTWKTIKNINLRVMPDGAVKVSAPWRTSLTVISRFVDEHTGFIIRARQRFAAHQKPVVPPTYETGALFRILGYEATLQVVFCEPKQAPYVTWSESEPANIYMYVKPNSTPADRGQLMLRFWAGLCEAVVKDMRDQVYNRYIEAGYDVPYPSLRIRKAKTRWGSCSLRTQRIMINEQLLLGPRHFLEYVMIHEFAHFIQPNHSAKFWRVVAEFMPQWQTIRHELTAYFRGY